MSHTHFELKEELNQDACQELQLAWNHTMGDICKKYGILEVIPFGQVNLMMMLRVFAIALQREGVDFEKTRLVYINSLLRMPGKDEEKPND